MSTPPLVIVGLDSGDPTALLKRVATGDLPNLGSMLESGTSSGLAGPEMLSSHGIWATLFSGQSVSQHGRYARRTPEPGSYRLRSVLAEPFWSSLGNNDREVLIIDAPEVELVAGLKGHQLAGWGEHPSQGTPTSMPAEWVHEVRKLAGAPIRTDERQRGGRLRDLLVRPRILRRVERKGALCRHMIRQGRPDLTVVVFGDTHAAGHRYAKYEAEAGGSGRGTLARVRDEVYRALDRELGRLLAEFPMPPNVFVACSTGFRVGQPLGSLVDDVSRALGHRVTHARANRSDASPPKSNDATVTRDDTDWSRTSVFVIPGTYTGYLRVNLEGREPQGIVSAGSDYEALLGELETDMGLLKDGATGKPLVSATIRPAELFGGGPPLHLPDLIVDFHPCTLPQTVVHPRFTLTRAPSGSRRGNCHHRRGLVIGSGPSIARRGQLGDLSPLDFAPLFQKLMGEPLDAAASRAALEGFLG